MSEQGEPGEDRTWVVRPPEPGEISLHLSFGDGVQLTSEQEEAINGLIRALESADAEVTGFAPKCKQGVCTKLTCTPVNCPNLACGTFSTTKAAMIGGGAWNLMGTFGDGSL